MLKYLSPATAIRELIPLSNEQSRQICSWRSQVTSILEGKDQRLLVIVGPCSVHNTESTVEYCQKLKVLSDELQEKIFIVARAYLEKPRTTHGWRGFLLDPDLSEAYDVEKGLLQSRALLHAISNLGLPIAYEFVELFSRRYLEDLISWGCIGARTCQSPLHRQLASTLPCPVGFKNPLSGESLPAVHGAMVAQKSQTLIEHDDEGRLIFRETPGNSAPHIVLRGGTCGPNYDESAVQRAKEELIAAHLSPAILIDCSHHNSSYNHLEQVRVAKKVVQQKQKEPAIRGIMLESFLLSGTQEHYKTSSLYELAKRNASILDPCLGWDETEELLQELARLI